MMDEFLDASPEKSRVLKQYMGIDDDYYSSAAPDINCGRRGKRIGYRNSKAIASKYSSRTLRSTTMGLTHVDATVTGPTGKSQKLEAADRQRSELFSAADQSVEGPQAQAHGEANVYAGRWHARRA